MLRNHRKSVIFTCWIQAALGVACAGHSAENAAVGVDSGASADATTGHRDAGTGACISATDCDSLVCKDSFCAPAHALDGGKKTDTSVDIDCSASAGPMGQGSAPCPGDAGCKTATDCPGAVCVSGDCVPASCVDGVKDGLETDVDCGGDCPPCATGKDCKDAADCQTSVCVNDVCQPPSPTDGVQNDSETDVDCGGATLGAGLPNNASDNAPSCAVGKKCALGTDCTAGVCNDTNNAGSGPINCPSGTKCTCQAPSDKDGVINDSETDVDCGGGASPASDGAPACMPGQHCIVASDCTSQVCTGATAASGGQPASPGLCQSPSCTDGVQNGNETDVDCGGGTCPVCAAAKKCLTNSDCASDGCDYSDHCAVGRSCTQHHGGDTCGGGEDTDLGSNPTPATGEESCCISLPIAGTSYTVDKYDITAGRIRAWATRLNGDLQSFTTTIPASNPYWNSAWNQYIPSTEDEVDEQLGPYPAPLTPQTYPPNDPTIDPAGDAVGLDFGQWRDGCTMGKPGDVIGARTWWTNKMLGADLAAIQYPQDFLDDKIINCIDAYMLTAFCIWDGGHLATPLELAAAWGAGPFPWSSSSPNVLINQTTQMPSGTDVNGLDASHYVVHEFGLYSQEFTTPYTYNYDPYGLFVDDTYHIGAPGRFPLGAGPSGHADLAGMAYEVTQINLGTGPRPPPAAPSDTDLAAMDNVGTLTTGSWEIHYIGDGTGSAVVDAQPWKPAFWAYWASTGRCAR
jgi:hypothetical protein